MDNKQREQQMREKRLREPGPDEHGQPTSEAGGQQPRQKRREQQMPAQVVIRD